MKFLKVRANRSTYWLVLVLVILMIAGARLLGFPSSVPMAALIFIAIPRLHDLGWSGWWVLLPLALKILGFFIALAALPFWQAEIVIITINLMIAMTIIWLGCLPGQKTWNEYGDPPSGLSLFRKKG